MVASKAGGTMRVSGSPEADAERSSRAEGSAPTMADATTGGGSAETAGRGGVSAAC